MRDAVSRFLAWLSWRRSEADSDEGADERERSDSGGFAGSLLDASVKHGHGQGDPQAASEMATLQEEASRLAEQDQHRDR